MKLLVILVILMGAMAACQEKVPAAAPQTFTMRVNYYRQPCQGEGPQDCLLVQQGKQIGSPDWDLFYGDIQGFAYEPGYVYTLKVSVEKIAAPPQDEADRRYVLVKVLSQEKVR